MHSCLSSFDPVESLVCFYHVCFLHELFCEHQVLTSRRADGNNQHVSSPPCMQAAV